jgi:hypothetical protein
MEFTLELGVPVLERDWEPRVEHLRKHGDAVPFPVFDRFAMFGPA